MRTPENVQWQALSSWEMRSSRTPNRFETSLVGKQRPDAALDPAAGGVNVAWTRALLRSTFDPARIAGGGGSCGIPCGSAWHKQRRATRMAAFGDYCGLLAPYTTALGN